MLCKLCLDPSESLRYGSRPIEHWDEERASHFCFVCRLFVWYITHSHCPIPAVEASISQTSWIESNTPIDGNVFYVQCFLSQKDKILFFFSASLGWEPLPLIHVLLNTDTRDPKLICTEVFRLTLVWFFLTSDLRINHPPLHVATLNSINTMCFYTEISYPTIRFIDIRVGEVSWKLWILIKWSK